MNKCSFQFMSGNFIIFKTKLLMANVELLLQQLTQIFSGSSTAVIKNAETRLLQLQQDSQFLPSCSIILQQIQVLPPIKKLLVIYLQKFSKRICKQKNVQKSVNNIQQFLSLLSNPKIQIGYKGFLSNALDIIVNSQTNRALKIQLTLKLIDQLKQSVNLGDESVNFAYLLFCGKAIFGTNNFNAEATQFTKSAFKEYLSLNIRLLNIAAGCAYESKQSFSLVHKLIKEYSSLIKSFLKRMGVLDIDGTKLLYLQQLQICVTNALALNFKQNTLSSPLFILIANDYQISKIINIWKSNYLSIICTFVRLLNNFVKHANLLSSNPLYLKLTALLEIFIKATSSLLEVTPYHTLPIQSGLLQSIDQLFNLYVQCLRMNDFYGIFSQYKNQLIEKVVFPCLTLAPYEASAFYQDSLEFIQSSMQVVERNIKPTGYAKQKESESQDFIRQYETLKTYAAQFLSSLCKFQDGTLTYIFQHAIAVLLNKVNTIYSKTTMLMAIACLKDHVKERKDLKNKLGQLFSSLLELVPIPAIQQNVKKQEDIEYAYIILAVSKYIISLRDSCPKLIDQSFQVGITVLQSPVTSEVYVNYVLDLFSQIMRIDEGQKFIFDIVSIFNTLLLNTSDVSIHLLDSYFDMIKYNSQILRSNPASLLQGLKILAQHIQKQAKKTEPVQLIINKCWNIIREVGENDNFIPQLIQSIELIVLPLVPYIDGLRNLDFQEDILLLMTSFINKGKRVTLNQQKMFEIIPKIFYNQYCCRFGQAFHTIQLFIYYGSEVLKNAFPAIQAIVQMSIMAITQIQYKGKTLGEIQNCQGVLILQSLVARCGDIFPQQMWTLIVKGILNRLDRKIKFHFLSSNLYALLALSLVHSLKFFADEDNQIMLNRILNNIGVFVNIDYSPKVIIVALIQLLMAYNAPFVNRRFTQILDITVSLLEISTNRKSNLFQQDDEDDEQKQYCNSILLLKNDMKVLDEFGYFKKKVEMLKQQNRQILVNSISQFPQAKKQFFINILTIEKVANVPRRIFKIKK